MQGHLNEEAKNQKEKILKMEKIIKREYLVYKTEKGVCNFQQYETISTFAKIFFAGKTLLDNADTEQSNL